MQVINIIKLMENKTIYAKSTFINAAPRYYRSFKYNVNQSSCFKMNNSTSVGHNKSVIEQTAAKTYTGWRKPSTYSNKKQSVNIKSPEVQNAQEGETSQLKSTYLQTWDKLLHSQKTKTQTKRDRRSVTQRVYLPSITEFQPSMFTSLDPLNLPIDHIEKGIIELKKEVPLPKIEMSQIHHDMINFKNKILQELEQTEKFGLLEFQKLRKMLRTDKVQCQQVNIRFKRQCQQLRDMDTDYKSNFQGTKPRLDILQDQIFSCRPFDLKRNQELDEQFPQEYF